MRFLAVYMALLAGAVSACGASASADRKAATLVDAADALADIPADVPADVLVSTPDAASEVTLEADAAVAAPDVFVLPADAPADTNVAIRVTSQAPPEGMLRVMALPAGNGPVPESDAITLYEGPNSGWPKLVYAHLQPGQWMFGAMLMDLKGEPVAGGVVCQDGLPMQIAVAASASPVQLVDLTIGNSGSGTAGSLTKLCNDDGAAGGSVLTEASFFQMPPTQFGMPHYLRGLLWGATLWVADSQDGLLHFSFPDGPPPPQQGWTLLGTKGCNAIARQDDRIYCGTRAGQLIVATVQPGSAQKASLELVSQPDAVGFDGMAILGGRLWLGAHATGLRALSPSPPYGKLPVTQPALKDVWDLLVLGPNLLAVADGSNGLVVLDVTASSMPQVTATLSLPGLSSYLHLEGTTLAVGAAGGGLHFVDVYNPKQPKLMTTLTLPDDVHGVTQQAGLWIASAGHHVYAIDLDTKTATASVRMALPVHHFAMDVIAMGADVLSLEFQSARRLKVDAAGQSQPLILPPLLHVAPAKPGDKLKTSLLLRNTGPKPLVVQKLVFAENTMVSVPVPGGPWPVPAGGQVDVPVEVVKTIKGLQNHSLLVYVGTAPQVVALDEVTTLVPGQELPPMEYQDGQGKLVNVQKFLAGKPGVVLVAAQSCPAAFLAMASAAIDLGPMIAQGKIAVLAINPWDTPQREEVALLTLPYPVLYTPMTTTDTHQTSYVLDTALGQSTDFGPPMPLLYVLAADGKIALAQWGYERATVLKALENL